MVFIIGLKVLFFNHMKNFSKILGWYGAFAILLAYLLLSLGTLQAHTFWYQFLNLTGAIGILISAFSKKDYPAGVLNLIWAVIAVVSLITIFLAK